MRNWGSSAMMWILINTTRPTGVEGPEGLAAVPVGGGGAWLRGTWATMAPPPAKFRMQFPRSTNRRKLKNRRISTIRTQIPTCAHGNCMRNCWLTAIAGHQGNASTRRSTSAAKAPLVWRAPERSEGRAAGHAGRGTRGRRGRTTCQRDDRSSRRGRLAGRPRRSPAPRPGLAPR